MELKVKELKNRIETKSVGGSFMVLVYSDNSFLANQYVNEIARIKNKTKVYIDSLEDTKFYDNVFDLEDNNLYVLNTEKFGSDINDFSSYKETIVICSHIDDKTKAAVLSSGIYCQLPKLQEWQVLDYLKSYCRGLDEKELKWLYDVTKGDIHRLQNELTKIAIFDSSKHSEVFRQINDDGGYSDLSSLTVFNFTNALLKKDTRTIANSLSEINNIDVDGMGLVSILYRNIKNIINIQMNPKATPEELGMSDKQFRAISYNFNRLSNDQLINIFEFITSIDSRLKSGELQMTNDKLIDFIVCNVLLY